MLKISALLIFSLQLIKYALGIWMTVILGWKWYQKKYGDGDEAKEMEAK